MKAREFCLHSLLVVIGIVGGALGQAWVSNRDQIHHDLMVTVYPGKFLVNDYPTYVAEIVNDGNITEENIYGRVGLSQSGALVTAELFGQSAVPYIILDDITIDVPQEDANDDIKITIPRLNPGDSVTFTFFSSVQPDEAWGTFQSDTDTGEGKWRPEGSVGS
jgi:hypothetical protein